MGCVFPSAANVPSAPSLVEKSNYNTLLCAHAELLSTTGRRVNVDTLEGQAVAVDASIWMIQFLKAMRDERGDLIKNAHLLGLFRRLCKVSRRPCSIPNHGS